MEFRSRITRVADSNACGAPFAVTAAPVTWPLALMAYPVLVPPRSVPRSVDYWRQYVPPRPAGGVRNRRSMGAKTCNLHGVAKKRSARIPARVKAAVECNNQPGTGLFQEPQSTEEWQRVKCTTILGTENSRVPRAAGIYFVLTHLRSKRIRSLERRKYCVHSCQTDSSRRICRN